MRNNLESIFEEALAIAQDNTSEILSFNHVELALAKSDVFMEAIEEVTGDANLVDELIELLEDRIDGLRKIDPRIVNSYRSAGKELPVRNSAEVIAIMPVAELISETRWHTGDVEASHVFLCLVSERSGTGMLSEFLDRVGINPEDVFRAMVDIEAEELGIEPNYSLNEAMFAGMGPEPDNQDYTKFITDLTAKVADYDKPFIGRTEIINRAIQVLCRKDKSNPVFVGEPGVGKTEITIGLAKMIADGKAPKQIADYKLYSVDLAGMIAGTKYRGEFEARLKSLLDGVKDQKVILFFDEIHTIVGCGATSGSSMDASNILKPYLVGGNIKFIGATTYKEFKDNIEKDSALMRRFQKVDVKEPTIDEAVEILTGLQPCYEEYHQVVYTKKAIRAAVELTAKYVHERFLPDKAIDMIDEAGAWGSINGETKIDTAQIEDVLSTLCKIPKKTIKSDEFKTVNALAGNLRSKVFGQDEAVNQIVDSIKLSKSGLGDEDRPIASFLFVGPTGTGKTEIAKQLAKNLGIELVRFDMSEYMEENSVSKLIGTSAGYVGYENGGLLTEAIRKTPHCVLLLDEIEKAHPAIFKSFLQVMDYGQMTDNQGRIADFRNCIIIMTSNAGAAVAGKTSLGFASNTAKVTCNTDGIKDAVKNLFSPEFRNRLTKTVVFNGINDEIGALVAKKELGLLSDKLAKRNITAEYTDACIAELVKRGVSPEFGAREIQRLVNSEIKVKFVDKIISGTKVKKFIVDYDGKTFTVESSTIKKAKEMLAE